MNASARITEVVRRTPVSLGLLLISLVLAAVGFVTLTPWPFLLMFALAVIRRTLLGWNLQHRDGQQW